MHSIFYRCGTALTTPISPFIYLLVRLSQQVEYLSQNRKVLITMQVQPNLRVFMITSEWPTPEDPERVPFIVRQVEFLRRAGVEVEVFHFRGRRRISNYY